LRIIHGELTDLLFRELYTKTGIFFFHEWKDIPGKIRIVNPMMKLTWELNFTDN